QKGEFSIKWGAATYPKKQKKEISVKWDDTKKIIGSFSEFNRRPWSKTMDITIFYREIPIHMNGETKMFVVHFLENKNVLLSQLLKNAPTVGEEVVIKGRKGKVSNVTQIGEKHFHVQLFFEKVKVNKGKTVVDNSKKKKR
ncbi:hypothetical protein V7111_02380, partial [Neobacillus niacini]|uniref:hypothetical protein n=1 Tax=Neobacillus niacini TaxID=86668 RepID=UPI00300062C5